MSQHGSRGLCPKSSIRGSVFWNGVAEDWARIASLLSQSQLPHRGVLRYYKDRKHHYIACVTQTQTLVLVQCRDTVAPTKI